MVSMALFTWSPNYALGHPQMDEEHTRLFALADQLHAALAQGAPKHAASQALAALIDETGAHFASEERLMVQHHYPVYLRHKAQHDSLKGKILEFQRDFQAGKLLVSADLLRFLKDWLAGHILKCDRRLASYLQSPEALEPDPSEAARR